MRVGIDARLLAEPITGIGRYLHEILSRMVDCGHEWYLYSHKPLIVGDWNKKNIYIKHLNLKGRAARMLWAQTILPFWASRDNLDLFWSPAHRIPTFLPYRISSVVTIHDLVWKFAGDTMRPLSRWLDSKLMPEAVYLADRVIAVSLSTARDLCEEMPRCRDKINVIPLGVSKILSVQSKEVIDSIGITKPFILFVGTLEPRKNLFRLLEAFANASKILNYPMTLVIAGGPGWGDLDFQKKINILGLQDHVCMLGYISEMQLSALYQSAFFLAMPSLYEGFGLPIVEAMARGCPVLTSNCSSMPEIAGNAGILVDPTNVASIEAGLVKLMTNKDLRKMLANNALICASRFSWDFTATATLSLFEELNLARKLKLVP